RNQRVTKRKSRGRVANASRINPLLKFSPERQTLSPSGTWTYKNDRGGGPTFGCKISLGVKPNMIFRLRSLPEFYFEPSYLQLEPDSLLRRRFGELSD